MDRRKGSTGNDDDQAIAGESFLSRFHRRKTEARAAERIATTTRLEDPLDPPADTDPRHNSELSAEVPPEKPLTDADMPPLETLEFGSDFSGFLSPDVSDPVRRAALRKLFHSSELNIVDGLDDYAEDYATFSPLGAIVTADMRHLIEVEARKKAEDLRQHLLDDQPEPQDGPQTGAGQQADNDHADTADTAQPSLAASENRQPDISGPADGVAGEPTTSDPRGTQSHA